MDLGLAGRVALVAASTSGLGFATAEQLVLEGAHVAICGRTPSTLSAAVEGLTRRAAASGSVAGFVADVSNGEDCQTLVERVARHFGRLDILVTNAGGPPGGTFATTEVEQYQAAMDLLLMSAVRQVALDARSRPVACRVRVSGVGSGLEGASSVPTTTSTPTSVPT